MNRRSFLAAIGLCVFAGSPIAEAQQPAKVPRIGVVTLSVAPSTPSFNAFRQGLRKHGYAENQNILVDVRYAEGKPDRLPALVRELVSTKVDVIVTESAVAARAARSVTDTIPIVTAIHGDPVGAGLAASVARPGGNVTGLSLLAPELSSKRLELLNAVVPKATQVAAFWNAENPAAAAYMTVTQAAARSLGLQIQSLEVRNASDLDVAFKTAMNTRANALITLPDGLLLAHKERIIEFAAKNRLPALYPDQEFAEAGGLLAYGPSLAAQFQRSADYVDKILRGAKPAELPIEQASTFELVINLKTAKELKLAMPAAVLQRADKVIE